VDASELLRFNACGEKVRSGQLLAKREVTMTWVIGPLCIDKLDTACVGVSPVDCIHLYKGEDPNIPKNQLLIDPSECIDCAACEPACPWEAIFPDSNLDAAVRKQVFAGDKMTEDDLKKLSTLKATGAGIRDLKGLEKCANLAALELADNQITDLTPLKGLTNLQTLTLSANKIQDISPLSDLTNLQYLELSRNEISEISALSKLTQLSALYLSGNRISNINAIQNLHKLSSLYLDGNKVSDLKPLADIRNLSSLDLSGNRVSDLSPISNMKYLQYLSLNSNHLSDLKPLVAMSKKDVEGEKSFAPYLFLAVDGNPLSAVAKTQLAELKGYGARLETEERVTADQKSVDAPKASAAFRKEGEHTDEEVVFASKRCFLGSYLMRS